MTAAGTVGYYDGFAHSPLRGLHAKGRRSEMGFQPTWTTAAATADWKDQVEADRGRPLATHCAGTKEILAGRPDSGAPTW